VLVAAIVLLWQATHRAGHEVAVSRPLLPVAARLAIPATPMPSPPWSDGDIARLHAELASAFAPAIDGADRWSLAVLAADGKAIYLDDADRAVTPASVQKLIVAATALDRLGPGFRYHTLFAARSAIGDDGALPGDLWYIGMGDPSLRSDDLRGGIAMLAHLGLQHIGGGVAVDAQAMRGPEINAHWDADDADEDYSAPTSAVSLDDDTVEFDVTGTTPGEAAIVRENPASSAVTTSGSIITSSDNDDVIIDDSAGDNSFALRGYIPEGATEKFYLPIHHVPSYAGAVIDRMLRDRGIDSALPPRVAPAPLDTIALWDHRSAPLRVLETHMLYVSDNHYAEQLLRTLGEDDGRADDTGGIAAERRFLADRSIATPGLRLYDGSGLADANRVAAITLAEILFDAQLRGGGVALYPLLPEGGREGTLRHYDFTTALGRVRAKTGHISGVSSLAGYVNTYRHGRVAFAFLINGSPGDPDSAIVSAVDRLVQF
jgi:D-alanyl-D-alanine carboxypeptidase/D-alanyl-D-alanine-endopeptidase (penicillin-binding protein 4)